MSQFIDLSAMTDPRREKFCKKFGENLKKLRLERGYAYRELAARAGLEHAQIARIEAGQVNPTLSTICFLAEALEVESAVLMAGL